ncbi:MAG: hypothetical protein HRU19_02975 [Pseudobacteriovorax sp.]|nr:hypothetical protein [Pseudobacteriovorax sp.]
MSYKFVFVAGFLASTGSLGAGVIGGNLSEIRSSLRSTDLVVSVDSSEYRRARLRASFSDVTDLPSSGEKVKLNDKLDLTNLNETTFFLPIDSADQK